MRQRELFRTLLKGAAVVLCAWQWTAAIGQAPEQIVAMSIACSNDHVYTWYDDGNVTIGNSETLDAYRPYEPPHRYSLPEGKTRADIVGMGIAGNDHVYTWYVDGTVSS